MIDGFFGEYRWLSNFHPSPITIRDKVYKTVEHYYQSRKCSIPEQAERIRTCGLPSEAKRLGAVCEIQDGFNNIRRCVMKSAIEAKFVQNPLLSEKLLDTGIEHIQETNHWGDTYWGVCNGKGSNHLGYIIMSVREDLRMNQIYRSFS